MSSSGTLAHSAPLLMFRHLRPCPAPLQAPPGFLDTVIHHAVRVTLDADDIDEDLEANQDYETFIESLLSASPRLRLCTDKARTTSLPSIRRRLWPQMIARLASLRCANHLLRWLWPRLCGGDFR